MTKLIRKLKHFYKSLLSATSRFYNEEYSYRVAALTYTTLLAIVPFLAVITFLISLFPIFSEIISYAEIYILSNFVPTSALAIERYFQNFIHQASHLPTICVIFLMIVSIMLIDMVQHTLNHIWKVRHGIKSIFEWLIAWVILVVAPIFVGLSVLIFSYLSSLPWLYTAMEFLGITKIFIFSISFFINIIIFTLIYIIIPNTHVQFKFGLLGGLVAAILFEFARTLFSHYILGYANYEVIYGAFAIFPIFLLWLYITWSIILFGALVSYALQKLE